jgi:DegV family protein with EDD domain
MNSETLEIITDSTCDIPQELIDAYGITVLPHRIIWGEQQYRDRVDLQPEEFYRRIETEHVLPTTACVSLADFGAAHERAAARGGREVLVRTVRAAKSGAEQAAVKAAETAPIPVHVVDSKGPTMTLGWQVLTAARNAAKGMSVPEILTQLERLRSHLVQLVALDTLEYLQKGGRIGDAARWIGTLLQIKPLVSINHVTGKVEPAAAPRTHKKAVDLLYQMFFERLDPTHPLHVAVLHGNAMDEALALADRIRKEFAPAELLVHITGPVLGINTGPRALALALCGFSEK